MSNCYNLNACFISNIVPAETSRRNSALDTIPWCNIVVENLHAFMLAANAWACINIWSWVSSYNVVFLPLNFSVDIDTQPASWNQIACNIPKVCYTKGHSITPKTVLNREMDTLRVESNGSPSRYISLLKYFGLIGKYFRVSTCWYFRWAWLNELK